MVTSFTKSKWHSFLFIKQCHRPFCFPEGFSTTHLACNNFVVEGLLFCCQYLRMVWGAMAVEDIPHLQVDNIQCFALLWSFQDVLWCVYWCQLTEQYRTIHHSGVPSFVVTVVSRNSGGAIICIWDTLLLTLSDAMWYPQYLLEKQHHLSHFSLIRKVQKNGEECFIHCGKVHWYIATLLPTPIAYCWSDSVTKEETEKLCLTFRSYFATHPQWMLFQHSPTIQLALLRSWWVVINKKFNIQNMICTDKKIVTDIAES